MLSAICKASASNSSYNSSVEPKMCAWSVATASHGQRGSADAPGVQWAPVQSARRNLSWPSGRSTRHWIASRPSSTVSRVKETSPALSGMSSYRSPGNQITSTAKVSSPAARPIWPGGNSSSEPSNPPTRQSAGNWSWYPACSLRYVARSSVTGGAVVGSSVGWMTSPPGSEVSMKRGTAMTAATIAATPNAVAAVSRRWCERRTLSSTASNAAGFSRTSPERRMSASLISCSRLMTASRAPHAICRARGSCVS